MAVGSNVIEFTIRGNDEFSGKMGRIKGIVGTSAKVVTGAAVAFAGAATAIAAYTNKVATAEDRAAKFARRINVAVDELTAYQNVAQIAGVEQQTFNMAVQRMTRRVSEAAEGTGEAQGAIAELGIEANRFQQMGLEDQLQLLGDRFNNLEGRADKVRLAFKLFDSEGVAMLQMLKNNSNEMQQLADDARMLGGVIDERAAANAEEFTTQSTRLTTAITGISRAVADNWIPVMAGLMKQAANVIASMRGEFAEWSRIAMRGIIGLGVVTNQIFTQLKKDMASLTTFEGWRNLWKGAQKAFMAILDGFVDILPSMVKIASNWFEALWRTYLELGKWAFRVVFDIFIKGFPTLIRAISQMFKVMWEGVVEIGRWAWEKIKGIFTGEEGPTISELIFRRLPEATEAARANLSRTFGQMTTEAPNLGQVLFSDIPRETAEARANIVEGYKELGARLSEEAKSFSGAFANHFGITADIVNQKIDEFLAKFQQFGEQTKETQEQVREAGTTYAEELRKLANKQLQETGSITRQMAKITMSAIDQMASGLGQVFADVLIWGKNLFDSLKRFAKQLLASIVKAIAKALILRAIMSSIGGGSGLLGGALGVAHKGMRYVPQEGTYLLQKGERVLSPQQNEDLSRALREGGGGGGGGVTIERVEMHVLENATSGDALLRMSPDEVREVVARKLIPALDQLDRSGVRPVALERQGV